MANKLISVFIVLLGRIPAWVPVAALFMLRLDIRAFILIYASMIAAKLLLYSYETGKTTLSSSIHSMWRYIYKPLLYIFIAEIVVYGLLYMVFAGIRADWVLGLVAFFFIICAWTAGIFIKKDKAPVSEGMLRKSLPMKVIITLLWLYVVFTGDYAVFKSMALILIYVFEYFTLYKPESEQYI